MAFIEPMHRNKPNITYLLLNSRVAGDSRRCVMSPYETAKHTISHYQEHWRIGNRSENEYHLPVKE